MNVEKKRCSCVRYFRTEISAIGKLGPNRQVTTKPYKFFQNIKYQLFLKALQTTFSININGGVVVTFCHVRNNFFHCETWAEF